MTKRRLSFVSGLLLSAAVIGSILVTPAVAKKKPPPPPPPAPAPAPAPSTSSTYVKNFASVVAGVKCDLTPQTVAATADGGSVLLALSSRPSAAASESCSGVNWIAKLDAFGNPQWQKAVGCFNLLPGSYSYGVSLQQTADGGYVLGGGTIGCGSETLCPFLGGRQCGFVEKLDAGGNLVWARVYSSGTSDTENSITRIRQTSDGGFVATGIFRDSSSRVGAWTLKLDGQGSVQWQHKLGPLESTYAYPNDVQQTADGGYVAAGDLYPLSSCQYAHGCGQGVLVFKLDANGSLEWQRGFNSFDGSGVPTASEHALTLTQSSDGGYLVAGNWGNSIAQGSCCRGALLLKLDANGLVQWQKAHSGGVHCYSFGKTTCSAVGATVYSVDRTSDGGYLLGGAGQLKLADGVPLVPWLAKTDADGNLVWQHFYYQSYPLGSPASQYFASSDVAGNGGALALGFTTNPSDYSGELLAVKTDGDGLVGACSQVSAATPLTALDPGLATIAPALLEQATTPVQADAPAATQATSVSNTAGQC
jgi:hypothetical protein